MFFCIKCMQFFEESVARFCPMCGSPLREGIAADIKLADVADPAAFARWLFDNLRTVWPDAWSHEGDNPRVGTLYVFDQTILLALKPRIDAAKLRKEIERRKKKP